MRTLQQENVDKRELASILHHMLPSKSEGKSADAPGCAHADAHTGPSTPHPTPPHLVANGAHALVVNVAGVGTSACAYEARWVARLLCRAHAGHAAVAH